MRIMRDTAAGTVTFLPSTSTEREALERVSTTVPVGGRINYRGYEERVREDLELQFQIGDRAHASIDLFVRGSAEDDRRAVGALRDALFCGSGELISLGVAEVDGATGHVFTCMRCKHCDHPMITRVACEWGTCDACAVKCDHAYEHGIIHGGGIDVGVGSFCKRCGRSKPEEPDLPLAVHHALAVDHLRRRGVNLTFLPPLRDP